MKGGIIALIIGIVVVIIIIIVVIIYLVSRKKTNVDDGSCITKSDCSTLKDCINGVCVDMGIDDECTTNNDCNESEKCTAGECVDCRPADVIILAAENNVDELILEYLPVADVVDNWGYIIKIFPVSASEPMELSQTGSLAASGIFTLDKTLFDAGYVDLQGVVNGEIWGVGECGPSDVVPLSFTR